MKNKNNKKNSNNTESDKPNIINFDNNPEIQLLIAILKALIDNLSDSFKTLEERIIELAKRLSESKLYEISTISSIIKEILMDKIKDGKITERYIEKCLPPEYKRKYEKKKSEVSSLSTKKKKAPLVVAENSGESFMIREEENANIHPSSELTDSIILNQDLENKNKCSADIVTKSESLNNQIKEIRIAKERFNEITDALNKCISSVFIRFNAKGIIESIEPDTIREQRLENVNDISNDDYTY